MKTIFIQKEILDNNLLTPKGLLAYISLKTIDNNINKDIYICKRMLLYYCVGYKSEYDRYFKQSMNDGVQELLDKGYIYKVCQISNSEMIYNIENMAIDTKKSHYTYITTDEIYKILNSPYKTDVKISILKYYIFLTGTYKNDNNLGEFSNKVGDITIENLCKITDLSKSSILRYNEILEKIKVLYIYRSDNVVKMASNNIRKVRNCYGRYQDKELIIKYGISIEDKLSYKKQIYTSSQGNYNRSMSAKYNAALKGKQYSDEEIKEIIDYIESKNNDIVNKITEKKNKSSLTDSEKKYIKKLESQIRDISFFN